MKKWIFAVLLLLAVVPAFGQNVVELKERGPVVTATFEPGHTLEYRLYQIDAVTGERLLHKQAELATSRQSERQLTWNKENGIPYVFEYRTMDASGNWSEWTEYPEEDISTE